MYKAKAGGGMEFKDMERFNWALFGKQGWRLMCNNSSLAFIVLKPKYIPRCDILNANLGYNPSFIWSTFLPEGIQ